MWRKFQHHYEVYARLHTKRLERLEIEALGYMEAFQKLRGDPLGMSYSGGKDSTLMLHLARKHGIKVIPFWFANDTFGGMQNFIRAQNVKWVHDTGWWEAFPVDYGQQPHWSARPPMDAIIDDQRELDELWGITGTFVGIRRDESRKRVYALREVIRPAKGYAGGWRCAPIASWKTDDVWAYTIANKLPVNPVYIDLVNAGAPARMLRVDSIAVLFESDRPAVESLAYMKKLYPEDIQRFYADNPFIHLW